MEVGEKFERKKVRIAEKVELFSTRTFFLQIFGSLYGSRGATTMADHSNDEEWNDKISIFI